MPDPTSIEIVSAHSPDSDDAFMFYGLATKKIRSNRVTFRHVLSDIETLNRKAMEGFYDLSAISYHAYPYVADKYVLMASGSSIGDGYGPMVVATHPMEPHEIKGKKIAIKSALLDQRVVAGVGNIYADESLFRANIHPLRAAGTLKRKELDVLADVIRNVLETAIEKRGSTLRDYRDVEGVNGNYQDSSWVYGRFGQACKVCGREIERAKIGGRSSHFCTRCQPLKTRLKKST